MATDQEWTTVNSVEEALPLTYSKQDPIKAFQCILCNERIEEYPFVYQGDSIYAAAHPACAKAADQKEPKGLF